MAKVYKLDECGKHLKRGMYVFVSCEDDDGGAMEYMGNIDDIYKTKSDPNEGNFNLWSDDLEDFYTIFFGKEYKGEVHILSKAEYILSLDL